MRRIWLASLFFFPALLHAQRTSDLREGARIQVTPVRGTSITGGFLSVANDSLTVVLDDAVATHAAISVRQIRDVRISNGRSHTRGAALGAVIGAGIGVVTGVAVGLLSGPDTNCSFMCFSRSETAVMGGFVFGGLGTIIGTIGGAIHGTESWVSVRLPRK